MTVTQPTDAPAEQAPAPAPSQDTSTERADRWRRPRNDATSRGIMSLSDWRRPHIRRTATAVHAALLTVLFIAGLGPMLWLAKAAVTPTQDTLRNPFGLFPHGVDWQNLATAWTRADIDKHFANTVVIAAGAWLVQLVIATTGGYALSVLRPRLRKVITGVVLATLFIPAVVLLVPLYLTILDTPVFHTSLINSYWAVWLPAGASAFNVLLVQRFFDNLPREVFEAARVDGAGPYRMFWSVVLPMSRPILGVVSVFAVIAAWKDYLWPMLVLKDPELQPLSVRLPALQRYIELDVFLAALAISTIIPVALFLVFQRLFLKSSGLGGAVKG